MATRISVQGFEQFYKTLLDYNLLAAETPVFALFSGSKNKITGESWCPDCVKAEPVIESCMTFLPLDATFIYCEVGDRDFWKDPSNSFRQDERLKLTCVPTLLRLNKVERLEEEECCKESLVQMLFEDS